MMPGPAFDRDNSPNVALAFNARGAAAFERITGENIRKRMAIVLDGKVHSAPTIQDRIAGGKASITGHFTPAEAQDLAIVLRAGSLPAPVSILEERTVGPSLGAESIRSGILAAAVGGLAVIIIMPLYYAMAGLLADVMLVFTILILMSGTCRLRRDADLARHCGHSAYHRHVRRRKRPYFRTNTRRIAQGAETGRSYQAWF